MINDSKDLIENNNGRCKALSGNDEKKEGILRVIRKLAKDCANKKIKEKLAKKY